MTVENLEQATSFCESVLRFKVASRAPSPGGDQDRCLHALLEPGTPQQPVFENLVENLEETKQSLPAAGCVVLKEVAGLPRCYLRDPYGRPSNRSSRGPKPA